MHTITLLNEKGGVGKTTLATYLAVGLALRGYRVLLIDSDAQGNSTNVLQLPKTPAFYNLMVGNAAWSDVIQLVPQDGVGALPKGAGLFCVPGNFQTSAIASHMAAGDVNVLHLRKRIKQLASMMDYIIFDTSPNPTILHEAILFATDYLILPTDCGSFSCWEGLPDTIEHTQDTRENAADFGVQIAEIIGIVPNLYRSNTSLSAKIVESLRRNYGELVWEPMPQRQAIQDSQVTREFLYSVPDTPKTSALFEQFVEKVLQSVGVSHGS